MLNENQKEMIAGASALLAENGKTETKENERTSSKETEKANHKKNNKRVRCFSGITYIAESDIIKYLSTCPWVQHWSVAHHDKDVWSLEDEQINPKHEHGKPKEAHTHILLYTYDAKTSSSVQKKFEGLALTLNPDNPQNTKMECCNDSGAMFRYQLHKDDPEKYQYLNEVRKCDDINYWARVSATDGMTDCSNNAGLAMVEDVLQGATEREMCERYGKEWIYHRKYILDSVHTIQREEMTSGNVAVDENLLKLMLSNSPFYQIDIMKFFEILKYIERECVASYGEKPDFSLYFNKK